MFLFLFFIKAGDFKECWLFIKNYCLPNSMCAVDIVLMPSSEKL